MAGDSPLVTLGEAQAGDVTIGDVAGRDIVKTTINGASADKLAEMLEVMINHQFLDDQRREIRQGSLDRRLWQIEVALVVLASLLVVALLVIGALVYDRLAYAALRLLAGAGGALALLYVRMR